MRAFLAGLALFLSFFTGTAALSAYVAHDVVLDPHRAGLVLEAALDEPDLRRQVLARVVPGYGRLPLVVRAAVDQLAGTAAAHRAARTVSLDPEGRVALAPVQRQIVRGLRAVGQPALAAQVAGVSTGSVTVPSKYLTRYHDARDVSREVLTRSALLTAALFVLAVLVSPRRRRTVLSVGFTVLLCCGVTALLFWLSPGAATLAGSGSTARVAAAVVRAQRPDVLVVVLPVAAAGLMLVVGSLLARPGRRAGDR